MKKQEIKITTLIGRDVELEGNLRAPGSVRIDGIVHGDVTIDDTLVLGITGVINGNVNASSAIIGGEINGDIKAPTRAELTSTARVIGDISTEKVVIDENAIFQGGCNMNQEVPERQSRSAAFRRARKNGSRTAAEAVAEALKEVREEQDAEETDTKDSAEDVKNAGWNGSDAESTPDAANASDASEQQEGESSAE